MHKFTVVGRYPLKGTLKNGGSKNSTLPILAACLMIEGRCIIKDVPRLRDVEVMKEVLINLGVDVECEDNVMKINAGKIISTEIPEELMRKMRASNLALGAMLARYGRAKISYPGGCRIGSRPMDLHLKGLKTLGAEIKERFGYIYASASELRGGDIHLDLPSVGATENLMMAASKAKGTTIIRNAAKEPEIVDLQNFLNKSGAKIKGAGTTNIKIEGVEELHPSEHTVIPDRIEAGTHMIASAITMGDVTITNVIPEHVEPVLAKLKEANIGVYTGDDWVRIKSTQRPSPVDIKTMPYPGFPTDMQPQFMALLTIADGTSVITETVFENRYKHVMELQRMGAEIKLEGNTAIIKGVPRINGARLEVSDLRAGASLLLAALGGENGSVLENVDHIDRGYERIEEKYNALGAHIHRVHS